jgi:uncharacterized membrane protein YhaH (DUF805 family)
MTYDEEKAKQQRVTGTVAGWLLSPFRGRLNRRRFILPSLLIGIVGIFLESYLEHVDPTSGKIILVVALAFTVLCSVSLQARRWHDMDRSAWWILINLVPIAGQIYAAVFNIFFEGTCGPNRFGPDPLDEPSGLLRRAVKAELRGENGNALGWFHRVLEKHPGTAYAEEAQASIEKIRERSEERR